MMESASPRRFGIAGVVWYGGYSVVTAAARGARFLAFLDCVVPALDPFKGLGQTTTGLLQQGIAAAAEPRPGLLDSPVGVVRSARRTAALARPVHGGVSSA